MECHDCVAETTFLTANSRILIFVLSRSSPASDDTDKQVDSDDTDDAANHIMYMCAWCTESCA